MSNWNDEMNQMLAAFDRQAKHSLRNIKKALKRDGLTLNAEFKQHFLRVSNVRINLTYDEFEMNSMFEDEFSTDVSMLPTADRSQMMSSIYTDSHDGVYSQMHDPVEIIDSSDEDDDIKDSKYVPLSYHRFIENNGSVNSIMDEQFVDSIINHGSNFGFGNNATIGLNDIAFAELDQHHQFQNVEASDLDEITGRSSVTRRRRTDYDWNEGQKKNKNAGTNSRTDGQCSGGSRIDKNIEANDDIPMMLVKMNQRVNSQRKRTATITSKNGATIKTKNGNLVAKEGPGEYYSEKMGSIAKQFKCKLCEYASHYKHHMNKHILTHTGEKAYQCDICQKGFIQLRDMKRHKVTHKNEIPFHCRGCFTGFSQKVDQKAHENVCKSRRYECHICKKYVTSNKNDFKMHMRKHNGEKPFRCEICMRYFSQKSNLKTHLDTIHNRINF